MEYSPSPFEGCTCLHDRYRGLLVADYERKENHKLRSDDRVHTKQNQLDYQIKTILNWLRQSVNSGDIFLLGRN